MDWRSASLGALAGGALVYAALQFPWGKRAARPAEPEAAKPLSRGGAAALPGSVASSGLREVPEDAWFVGVYEALGVAVTPYAKRRGCPRQGNLCPSVRSLIVLRPGVSEASVAGLQSEFSHVWVMFDFDANTRPKSSRKGGEMGVPSKVRPPGLTPGSGLSDRSRGALATRTPHRPNPIGLSLVSLAGVSSRRVRWPPGSASGPLRRCVVLDVRGLDLVDGTPILDVKP